MKKNKKQHIMFVLILATNLFMLFYLNYRSISQHQMLLANGLYHNWAIQLLGEDWSSADILNEGGRIFHEHTLNGNVRTIEGIGTWTPPMMEGEFFSDEDTLPLAVVGAQIFSHGEDVFVIQGQEFTITGVMGETFPTILDYMVLMTGTDLDQVPVERIVVDGDERQIINRIMENVDSQEVFSQRELMRFATRLQIGRDLFEEMMIINTVLITLLFIAISSHAYFILNKKNNEIFHLTGFTPFEIIRRNHFSLTSVYGAAILVSFLADILLGNSVKSQNYSIFLAVFILHHIAYFLISLLHGLKGRVLHV